MGGAQTGVRVELAAEGTAQVATGLPVLDHLVGLLARTRRLRLTLEVAPGSAEEEVAAAGHALGAALAEPLRSDGACGRGWAYLPSDEALAGVVVEVAERPLVATERRLLRPARRRARDRRGRALPRARSPSAPG